MFTYGKGIYKRIMKPAGLKYIVDSDKETELSKCSPRNQIEYWRFIYPKEIINLMKISTPEALSTINTGQFSNNYLSNAQMQEIRIALKGGSSYLKDIYDHLDGIIERCASIETILYSRKDPEKILYVNDQILKEFKAHHKDEVLNRKKELIYQLSSIMHSLNDEIISDKRFNDDIKELIRGLYDEDPVRLLGLLCTFALFPENEGDKKFVESICRQYCDGLDIDSQSGRKNNIQSHDLTSFIDITEKSVLYRESIYKEIVDELNNDKSIVLSGFGGCGKTTLARLVYSKLKSEYDYCGWINYTGNLMLSMISDVRLDEYSDETMTENDIQKKWKYIIKMLANNKKSKLFVIDNVNYIEGVQSPITDDNLVAFSGWDNIKVIITTRLSKLAGYDNVKTINNLDKDKCIELFYHYNPEASKYRDTNIETIRKICDLASNNTMVIELLAKGSRYDYYSLDEFYEKLNTVGFKYVNEVPVETLHDHNVLSIADDSDNYYDIGNETAASQLMKLFNLKTRSLIERLILWDFHCLPEAEKVSRKELNDWMGYTLKDVNCLVEEGWIQYSGDSFSIHPLIRQAITCAEIDWHIYWEYGEEYRARIKPQKSLVSLVKEHKFYSKEDDFNESLRKINFTNYLTYGGEPLQPEELLYVADYARKRGARDVALKYYQEAYFKLRKLLSDAGIISESFIKMTETSLPPKPWDIADPLQIGKIGVKLTDDFRDKAELFWRCTYYYGYMMSYTVSGYDKAAMLILQAYYILLEIGEGEFLETAKRLSRTLDHLGYILSNYQKDNCAWVLCAEHYLSTAIDLRKKIVDTDQQDDIEHLHDLAWSQDNLGNLYAMLDPDKLEINTVLVVEVSKLVNSLLDYDVDAFMLDGYTLVNDIKDKVTFLRAERYLKEALGVREKIAEKIGYERDTEVAWTLCNLARLLSQDVYRHKEAEELILRALHLYEELDKTYPEQHLSSMARTYRTYAHLLEQNKDRISEAEECLEKALSLNEKLESDYPGIYKGEIEQIQQELSRMTEKAEEDDRKSQKKTGLILEFKAKSNKKGF